MTTGIETLRRPIAPPRLRPARFEDYPRIERLESAHGLLTLPAQDWREIWTGNPVLSGQLGECRPIGWVLEDDAGRIVGSLANIPTRYTFRGQSLMAALGRGWVVAPDYRASALWLMDEYFNQDRVDLFINTTVNALARDAFGAFGSVRVPLGDWETASYWITSYFGFACAALRIKGVPVPKLFAGPVALGIKVKDTLAIDRLPEPSAADPIADTDVFDSRFDAFWEELVSQNPEMLLCVRDRATLTWHFAGSLREGRARIFTVTRNGLLRAYCVLKRQDHPSSGLVRMRLVDYQNLERDKDCLAALVGAAHRYCVAKGIHTLEHVGRGLPKMAFLDRYAPYRRSLGAWPYYYYASDPTLGSQLTSPTVWDPSSYDGDASL